MRLLPKDYSCYDFFEGVEILTLYYKLFHITDMHSFNQKYISRAVISTWWIIIPTHSVANTVQNNTSQPILLFALVCKQKDRYFNTSRTRVKLFPFDKEIAFVTVANLPIVSLILKLKKFQEFHSLSVSMYLC